MFDTWVIFFITDNNYNIYFYRKLFNKYIYIIYRFADCEVEWHFNQVGNALPPGVYKRGNQVFIPNVQQQHSGNYICTVFHQFGRAESNPGRLDINKCIFY